MRRLAWLAWHLARGHIVLPGHSPAIPGVPVWRCHRCGLVKQAL